MASHVITHHESILKISFEICLHSSLGLFIASGFPLLIVELFKDLLVMKKITLTYLYALCNKKHRSTRSRSSIYLLRKELQEKHLRAVKESPSVGSSSNAAADSMLLSFVNSPQPAYRPQITEAATPSEASLSGKSSYDDSAER